MTRSSLRANLTHAGLLKNLEMGLRIEGPMAVAKHLDLFIADGTHERQTQKISLEWG
jgi:hypothetical protein